VIHHIPDEASLWRAIQPAQINRHGEIKPSYFRDNRGGYSCDIAAFSSREKSRLGYTTPAVWSDEAGLVEFKAGDVRSVGADVEHKPLRDPPTVNYSHAQFTQRLSADGESTMATKKAVVVIPPKRK